MPSSGRDGGRHVPEAGAQGRATTRPWRRPSTWSCANGSIGKAGIALTSVGPDEHQGDGRRGVAGRRRARRRGLRRGRAPGRRGVQPRRPTSAGAPSTSGTWSRCTCGAAWPAPSRWPARPEPRGDAARWKSRSTSTAPERTADVEPRQLLVHLIREDFELTGTHIGCDTTSCGACTVLLDGVPVKSCTMFGVQADGRSVTTVEGLAGRRRARPDPGGVQGGARPAVRVLHAGHDARRRGADRREPRPDRRRRAVGDLGQHLPVHRLHEHREGDPGRGRDELEPERDRRTG